MKRLSAQHQAQAEAPSRRHHVRRLGSFGRAATGQDRPGQSHLDLLAEVGRPPRRGRPQISKSHQPFNANRFMLPARSDGCQQG